MPVSGRPSVMTASPAATGREGRVESSAESMPHPKAGFAPGVVFIAKRPNVKIFRSVFVPRKILRRHETPVHLAQSKEAMKPIHAMKNPIHLPAILLAVALVAGCSKSERTEIADKTKDVYQDTKAAVAKG